MAIEEWKKKSLSTWLLASTKAQAILSGVPVTLTSKAVTQSSKKMATRMMHIMPTRMMRGQLVVMINSGPKIKIEGQEKLTSIKANLILTGKLIKDGNSLYTPPPKPPTKTLILQDLSLHAAQVLKRNPKLNLSSPTSRGEKKHKRVRATTTTGSSAKTKTVTKIKESKSKKTGRVKRKLSMPAGAHSEIMIPPSATKCHTGLCQRNL